jgi:hypothetical protein
VVGWWAGGLVGCGLRSVGCGLRYKVCGVRCAVCGMRSGAPVASCWAHRRRAGGSWKRVHWRGPRAVGLWLHCAAISSRQLLVDRLSGLSSVGAVIGAGAACLHGCEAMC